MGTVNVDAHLTLKNILYLTDFSEPSEAAIPFAIAIAREYGAGLHALHVLTPVRLAYVDPESAGVAIEGTEDGTSSEMQRIESLLGGVAHEIILVRGESLWQTVEQMLSVRQMPAARAS